MSIPELTQLPPHRKGRVDSLLGRPLFSTCPAKSIPALHMREPLTREAVLQNFLEVRGHVGSISTHLWVSQQMKDNYAIFKYPVLTEKTEKMSLEP